MEWALTHVKGEPKWPSAKAGEWGADQFIAAGSGAGSGGIVDARGAVGEEPSLGGVSAELDVAEAQLWYETQRSGLGAEFHSQVSQVIDRLAETPLIYQLVHRDIRRAIVHRFPYLLWYRAIGETVTVLACTYAGRDPEKVKARLS